MEEEQDQESKTEEATPRKLEQLREKGQVAKSADISGMATAVGVIAALAFVGESMAGEVALFTQRALSLGDGRRPLAMLTAATTLGAQIIVPLAAVAALGAIATTLIQTKGLFAVTQLAPKPERMDPIKGIKKVLPTKEMLVETAKSFLKVSVVAFLVYRAIEQDLPRFAVLPAAEPENAAAEVGSIAGRLVIQGMLILSALAGFDYFLAWRKFKRESKMTKHEIREEHKHQEGDPHLKAKRRGKQRELSKNRAVTDVRNATCLVTNPTHIAVALRYEPDLGDPAPMMLCQGVDEIALRMRAAAREHGIPILENKPLARALRASGKVGQPIPFDLYEAAARVIAHVMTIRRGASA